MHFASLPYLGFLAAVVCGSLLLRRAGQPRAENMLLLALSYWFYSQFSAPFCLCLFGLTVMSFQAARVEGRRAGLAFELGVAGSLGVLGIFKYHDFFAAEVNAAAAAFGWELSWPVLHLALPLGLSFYCFQTIAYLCDVRWGRIEAHRNFLDHALFLGFFPQLLAGPIERSQNLMPQLAGARGFDWGLMQRGLWLLVFGLYKKLCIADPLAPLVAGCFDGSQGFGRGQVALGALLFCLQIYADFSGYTDIARGSARLLGVELSVNFRQPLFARNMQDYWARWHLSLSTWIRDYLFYPIVRHPRWGRRLGMPGALLCSYALMGAWHGANWTYLCWGLAVGLLLLAYQKLRPALYHLSGRVPAGLWTPLGIALTFVLICLAEILFRARSLAEAGAMYAALFAPAHATLPDFDLLQLSLPLLPLLLHDLFATSRGDSEDLQGMPWLGRRLLLWSCVLGLLLHQLDAGADPAERFLYYAF